MGRIFLIFPGGQLYYLKPKNLSLTLEFLKNFPHIQPKITYRIRDIEVNLAEELIAAHCATDKRVDILH